MSSLVSQVYQTAAEDENSAFMRQLRALFSSLYFNLNNKRQEYIFLKLLLS